MSQTFLHGPMNVLATKFLGLGGRFGIDLSAAEAEAAGDDGDGCDNGFEDNWSLDWWKLFMKLGPLHPKASWGVTRGQITKTAPLVKNYRQVRGTMAEGKSLPWSPREPTHDKASNRLRRHASQS